MTATTERPAGGAAPAGARPGAERQRKRPRPAQLLAPLSLAAIVVTFGVLSENFLTGSNLQVVLASSALLALAAVAMTVVVRAGGIDLSVGVAVDLGAYGAAALVAAGYVPWVAVVGGLLCALVVGAVNAVLVTVVGIRPFLATLAVWLIGSSAQQLLTGGGAPIYLSRGETPDGFRVLGNGQVLGFDVPVAAALVGALVVAAALGATVWGRVLTAAGDQPSATRIAGGAAGPTTASAYLLAALVAGLAGVLLASKSSGFVPFSGQLYVLDAIGAVFIGATLSRTGRTSVVGSLVGVLIFTLLSNGMNLVALSAFWQDLARGLVLLAVLVAAAVLARRAR